MREIPVLMFYDDVLFRKLNGNKIKKIRRKDFANLMELTHLLVK